MSATRDEERDQANNPGAQDGVRSAPASTADVPTQLRLAQEAGQ